MDASKATCLSVILSLACPQIHQWQFFETVLGVGGGGEEVSYMLHTLTRSFEITTALSLSVFMNS